jgi:hypothetical protein
MRTIRTVLVVATALAATATLPSPAHAEPTVTMWIEKNAYQIPGGGVRFVVHVTCGPLPGSPDFREGFAGASQFKTKAEAEGGLSPDVTCDGGREVYTAALSAFTDEGFARGFGRANATVIACNSVGDQQVCVQGSSARQIYIRPPA